MKYAGESYRPTIDLDVVRETEYEYCVRCYAEEGKYSEKPCRLIVDYNGPVLGHEMKLPHFGRKHLGDKK